MEGELFVICLHLLLDHTNIQETDRNYEWFSLILGLRKHKLQNMLNTHDAVNEHE